MKIAQRIKNLAGTKNLEVLESIMVEVEMKLNVSRNDQVKARHIGPVDKIVRYMAAGTK